jgi:RNA-directed DNA polymerase
VKSYRTFKVKKEGGGFRVISAPNESLDLAQRKILATLEGLASPTAASHGFVRGRSILTNAAPHIGRLVVARVDVESFFHSITINRVAGIMRRLGIPANKAKDWSLVCTQSVPGFGRVLPQGACTSPLLSNLAASGLDSTIQRICIQREYDFTRYADDITISTDNLHSWPEVLGLVKSAIRLHGFTVNDKKTMVMFAHCKQTIAGIVVNARLNVSSSTRRINRAAIHNSTEVDASIQGMASHIKHVRGY